MSEKRAQYVAGLAKGKSGQENTLARQISRCEPARGISAPRQKYGARRTVVNGITFASAAEARRYQTLVLAEQAGEISSLELQPEYPIIVNGVKVCTYRADFRYVRDGETIVEDVKGMRSLPLYRLKAKLVRAVYGVEVREVR